MAFLYSAFQTPAPRAPAARPPKYATILNYAGLDLINPPDNTPENRSPSAHDFRVYDSNSDNRKVQITTRRGSGVYSQVRGETIDVSETSTTGADTTVVDTILNWRAQKFVPSTSGLLTRIELNLQLGTGFGPLIVEVYDSNMDKIADSSVLEQDIQETLAYTPARFIEAPQVTSGQTYYIVMYVQDNGHGDYILSTTTNSTNAYESNSGAANLIAQTYSLNYKTYISPNIVEKGLFRFNQQGGTNRTMVVYSNGTNDVLYEINDNTGVMTVVDNTLNKNALDYSFEVMDGKLFYVNGLDGLRVWDGTTVSTITDAELPILNFIRVYKDRLWGVSASEPNKIIFSEAPGNPVGSPVGQQWYNAYLSTSFMYQPAPKVADPIIALEVYQDVLKVLTTGPKIDIYGYDDDTFSAKKSPDHTGTVSRSVASDGQYLYCVSDQGIIRHNGTSGVNIATNIQPVFDGISDKTKVNLVVWKNTLRVYYGSGPFRDILVYDIARNEWMHDTETHAKRGVVFSDTDDDGRLVESSSLVQAVYQAETGYSNLGKAIDFEYWTKYESLGAPAMKKRILKYFPLFEPSDIDFSIKVSIDKDLRNEPTDSYVTLTTTGTKWGQFNWDEADWGSNTAFNPVRLRFPGYAFYYQIRISRRAVNNQVKFYGSQYSYKLRRL